MLWSASLVSSSSTVGPEGGGGGGISTVTVVLADVLSPRVSVQTALTVTVAGLGPLLSVAVFPLPEMLPSLAVQLATVTGTESGLVHVQETLTVAPAGTVDGLAEQLMLGGFFGGSLTMKLAEQEAIPLFFTFGSVILTTAV